MTRDGIKAVCLALPGVRVEQSFGPGHDVCKVGGKMFATVGVDGGCSFKVSDIAYEVLTGEGRARPAPYLARAKWVHLDSPDAWDDAELTAHLEQAHALVSAKLTRAARRQLGLG